MDDTDCPREEISNIEAEPIETELYTVDICPPRKYIIYGGKNDTAEVYSYEDDRIVTRLDGFSDSIILTKFVSEDRFITVTADGTITLAEYEQDVHIVDLDEDLTAAAFSEKLLVGTAGGRVHLYDAELVHINTFGSHTSEIIALDYKERRILSMSATRLVAHDEQGRVLYTLKAGEAYAFKYIASDVLCFARDGRIQVFKQNRNLFEYSLESRVETVELVGRSLAVGGEFDHILLIDTAGHYAIFKLDVGVWVNMIKCVGEHQIVFSSVDGLIGTLDIRNINSLKYFSPGVGEIFDFSVSGPDVAVVGEAGFAMVDVTKHEAVELTSRPV